MRMPLPPIREPDKSEYIASLRDHVEDVVVKRLVVEEGHDDLQVHVTARDMRDYVAVKVYLTREDLVPEAQRLGDQMMDELSEQGHRVFIYVRVWAPRAQAARIAAV